MILSIDYLTLVVAGAALYKVGDDTSGKLGWLVWTVGVVLFAIGVQGALFGALGI